MKKLTFVFLSLTLLSCPKKTSIREDETWLGFYLNGKKVGYSYQKFQVAKDYLRFYNRTKMRMRMGEETQELLTATDCFTTNDFNLQKFRFELISPKQKVKINGWVQDDELYQEVLTAAGLRRTKMPLEGKVYPSFAIPKFVHHKKLKKGREYTLPTFEPVINKIIPTTVVLLGEEETKIADSTYLCQKIKVTMMGNISFYWIDNEGRLLKEETPPQMLAIMESPQEALSQEKGEETVDIISYFSIKADTIVLNPKGLEYLKVELGGIEPKDFDLNTADQKVIAENPLTLEIRVPKLEEKPIPLPLTQPKEFLKPSLYIQSDNEEIKKKAMTIKGEKDDAQEVAKRILFWINEKLRKIPTASLPSAVDVLKNGAGDCNEHSILYAALCRAVGIPAKVCVGLIYSDGSFYYHAWNLVYLGRWVACDPTFGEFPANPTHIILKEGEIEEQAKVLKAVGNIRIKILEFN